MTLTNLLFPNLETPQVVLYFVCRVVLSLTILDCTVWLAAIKLTCLGENTCVSQIFLIQHFKHGYKKDASIDLDLMHVMFLQTLSNYYLEKNISVFFDVKRLKKQKLNWNESKLTFC